MAPESLYSRPGAQQFVTTQGLRVLAADVPAVVHNQATNSSGLYGSPQRQNIVRSSAQLDHVAHWTTNTGTPKATSVAGQSLQLLTSMLDTNLSRLEQTVTGALLNSVYTLSFYIKAGTTHHARFLWMNTSENEVLRGFVNAATGEVVVPATHANFAPRAYGSVAQPDGSWRVWITIDYRGLQNMFKIAVGPVNDALEVIAAPGKNIWIGKVQVEPGLSFTDYILTQDTAVTAPAAYSADLAPSLNIDINNFSMVQKITILDESLIASGTVGVGLFANAENQLRFYRDSSSRKLGIAWTGRGFFQLLRNLQAEQVTIAISSKPSEVVLCIDGVITRISTNPASQSSRYALLYSALGPNELDALEQLLHSVRVYPKALSDEHLINIVSVV